MDETIASTGPGDTPLKQPPDLPLATDLAHRPMDTAAVRAVIEVRADKPLTGIRFAAPVGLLIAALTAVLLLNVSRLPLPLIVVILVAMTALVVTLVTRGARRFARRRGTGFADALRRLGQGEALDAAARRLRCLQPDIALRSAAEALATDGAAGTVIRGGPRPPSSIAPLTMQFEAVSLNEVEPRFQELFLHGSPAGDPLSPQPAPNRKNGGTPPQPKAPLGSAVSRNVRLKGGWALVVLFALTVALHAYESLLQRRLTFQLVLWSCALLALLLLPATGLRATRTEWYLLPGGALRRQARWGQSRWTLHVFEPGRCVLLVFPRWRRQWCAAMSDGATTAHVIGTQHEMTMFVRAWLSPLSPPPVDRLTDLL